MALEEDLVARSQYHISNIRSESSVLNQHSVIQTLNPFVNVLAPFLTLHITAQQR
jgi:hypothetical protein